MNSRAAAAVARGGKTATPACGGGSEGICNKGRGGGWTAACHADSIATVAGFTANSCGSNAVAVGGESEADASTGAGGCFGNEGCVAGCSA